MNLITIDRAISTPPSEQLVRGVIKAIRMGSVVPSQQLPSVRAMAADLGVSPNTVVRAYRLLEEGGWVTTSRRRGTFVATPPPQSQTAAFELLDAIETYLDYADALGYSPEAAALAVLSHAERVPMPQGDGSASSG